VQNAFCGRDCLSPVQITSREDESCRVLLFHQVFRLLFERAGLLLADQFLDLVDLDVRLFFADLPVRLDDGEPTFVGIVDCLVFFLAAT